MTKAQLLAANHNFQVLQNEYTRLHHEITYLGIALVITLILLMITAYAVGNLPND